jgi:hypothetical protein
MHVDGSIWKNWWKRAFSVLPDAAIRLCAIHSHSRAPFASRNSPRFSQLAAGLLVVFAVAAAPVLPRARTLL